jgi:hypothetical protein
MEFDELDESRRVAALSEAASRRAKEKQRARKKAKLLNESAATTNSSDNNAVDSSAANESTSAGTLGTATSSSGGGDGAGGLDGHNTTVGTSGDGAAPTLGEFPDDITVDSQQMLMSLAPDNQYSMSNHHSSSTTSPPPTSSFDVTSSEIAATSIGGINPELRIGRWTAEETHYCDILVAKFMAGRLPLPDGIKLNEFLSSMLKSKQSRLTKKMKNAKLSSKTFRRTTGYLTSELEACEFSEAEDAFFHSLQNQLERCEMRFHTRKEWRETFSTYCVSHGQMVNADAYMESIDEMDRRVHRAKDRMRMERRKVMMGHALRHDLKNPNRGVVIDDINVNRPNNRQGSVATTDKTGVGGALTTSYNVNNTLTMDSNGINGQYSSYSIMENDDPIAAGEYQQQQQRHQIEEQQRARARSLSFALPDGAGQSMTSPFLSRIINFIHRHNIPFEYVDAWVPSFVPDGDSGDSSAAAAAAAVAATGSQESNASEQHHDELLRNNNNGEQQKQTKCRLCFAGSIVAKQVIVGGEGTNQYRRAVPLSSDDQFNLAAFGDYSASFSFDVGCGLPGRVYLMGVPTWEQSVHNAPLHHFERVGGAQQWGIRTVVGIPVPSPNVGRVVVILYSRHDRQKDHDMVIRLTEEFTRLLPSPKWMLVVDVGRQQQQLQQAALQEQDQQEGTGQVGGAVNASARPPGEDPAALSSEVISMFGEHMPSDPKSPAFAYLQGFMSLRLLLLRQNRTDQEQDLINTMLSSYSSYKAGGRTPADIALMLARDFIFLSQQQQIFVPSPQGNQQYHQQQPVQNGKHYLYALPQRKTVPSQTSHVMQPQPEQYQQSQLE